MNMTRRFFSCLLAASLGMLLVPSPTRAEDDAVILNSGETVRGRIVADTGAQIEIEVGNESHTIFTTRVIEKTEIKEIHKLTDAQRQEIEAYEALRTYDLNSNQELRPTRYAEGIAAFGRFLASYPESKQAAEIAARRSQWRSEKQQVEAGRVKFGNRWMSPEAKKTLAEDYDRRQLEGKLAAQVRTVRAAKANAVAAERQYNTYHDYYHGKNLPHPEWDRVVAQIHAYRAEVPKAQARFDEARRKFDELFAEYQKVGGTINYREQIDH